MTLWLMSYINQQEEGVPMPGKLALSSPGSALTAEERWSYNETACFL